MRIFSILIFTLIVNFLSAQDDKSLFSAIGKADIETLSTNFDSDIEICIGVDQDFYSKSEAKKKLKGFFSEVTPSAGSFLHKGSNKNKSSKYSVGELKTAKGKYRVFIYYEGAKISGLMFNPE